MSRVDEARRKSAARDADPGERLAADPLEIANPIALGDAFPAAVPPTAAPPPQPGPGSQFARPPAPAVVTAPRLESLIHRIDDGLSGKLVVDQSIAPVSREQYRRLAASLHLAQAVNGLKVVMVGSAVPGEGKTLTAANLALTLSESYHRNVLLIDADLRRPSLHQVFGIDNSTGLSEGLKAVEERKLPVRQVSPRLAVLPAGRPDSDPMSGLTSPRMHRLLAEARELFDWVIIDTPPVGLLSDANLLSGMVDGALFVVGAGSTPYNIVLKAIEVIGRDKTLGVVLNRVEERNVGAAQAYYDDYYGAPQTSQVP
jgi:protein-tyrosine kinase